jgi:hypothetical protein
LLTYINICKIVIIMEFLNISKAEEEEGGAPAAAVCSTDQAGPGYSCRICLDEIKATIKYSVRTDS